MKKKALLLYPETPTTYWSMKYLLKHLGKKAAFAPLGIITIAAMLPENYEPVVCDLNVSPINDSEIASADIIFISSMIVQKESLQNLINRCKSFNKIVVAGGPYPTTSHEKIKGVDYFLLGEAENIFTEFINDYEKGIAKKYYYGNDRPDIFNTPIPRFDLLQTNNYVTMAIQYSRGCPFNCEFCDIIEMFGRKPRTKSVTQFISELDALYNHGYRGPLFIVDDNFIGNKKSVRELLPKLIQWQKVRDYPFILSTEASVNLSEDDLLMDAMVKAGFVKVFLGIETPVEECLITAQKQQNTKTSLLESVRKIQNKGIDISSGFIVGFDNDPHNIFDLQIDFIQSSGIPQAMVGLLQALPNTQLYRRLEVEGRMLDESDGNNTHSLELNFKPIMDSETLVKGYKRVLQTIYSPEAYFKRSLDQITFVPTMRHFKAAFTRDMFIYYIRVFLFSIFRQTFSSYSITYWKFLFKVLFRNPKNFPKAIRSAFVGHHFFLITRDILKVDSVDASLEKFRSLIHKKILQFNIVSLKAFTRSSVDLYSQFLNNFHNNYTKLHKGLHVYVDNSMHKITDDLKLLVEKGSEGVHRYIEKQNLNKEKVFYELEQMKQTVRNSIDEKYNELHDNVKIHMDELLEHYDNVIDSLILKYSKMYG